MLSTQHKKNFACKKSQSVYPLFGLSLACGTPAQTLGYGKSFPFTKNLSLEGKETRGTISNTETSFYATQKISPQEEEKEVFGYDIYFF
jgi:hypothetical protein